MSRTKLYSPPVGSYDMPYTWVFDLGSTPGDGNDLLNQFIYLQGGLGDFALRRVVGLCRLLQPGVGRYQLYDRYHAPLQASPLFAWFLDPGDTQPREQDFGVAPEEFYKATGRIGFDLYALQRPALSPNSAQIAFQGVRRITGAYQRKPSYRSKPRTFIYKLSCTIDAAFPAGPYVRRLRVTDYDFELYNLMITKRTCTVRADGPFAFFSSIHGSGKGLGLAISKMNAPGGTFAGPPVEPVNNTVMVGSPFNSGGASGYMMDSDWLDAQTAWMDNIQLHGSDSDLGDGFGTSVDLSGETSVAGAPEQGVPGNAPGAAYVFVRDPVTGVQTQQQKLTGSTALDGEGFGIAVSIDGDTIAVGKYVPLGGAPGEVYIFTRTAGVWTQVAIITPSDSAAGDFFGAQVLLSGGNLFVGKPGDPNGSVYWFTGGGAAWVQQQKLVGANPGDAIRLGGVSAWDGTTLAIGSPGANASAGIVQTFTIVGGVLTLQTTVVGTDTVAGDQFGTSAAVSGTVLAVGSRNNSVSGAAYVFRFAGGSWNQTQKFLQPDPTPGINDFGQAVALFMGVNASWLAVGAPARGTGGLGVAAGAVYYFQALCDPGSLLSDTVASLLIYDQNHIPISSKPMLDIYCDGSPESPILAGVPLHNAPVYGDGAIVPPLFYQKDSQIQIDFYSQIENQNTPPVILDVYLIGKQHYPC